jgi:hypothetical protein
MDREEFIRRVMEILSGLPQEQVNRIISRVEKHVMVWDHHEAKGEKRTYPTITLIWMNNLKRIWSNLQVSSPVTGNF